MAKVWYNPIISIGTEEVTNTEYRTTKLRMAQERFAGWGGIEGYYRHAVTAGLTRAQIAAKIGISVRALEAWITRWNKAAKEAADNGPGD